jgi:hypothetical protein
MLKMKKKEDFNLKRNRIFLLEEDGLSEVMINIFTV